MQQRVKDKITESLQYSCLYWFTHFTVVNRDTIDQLVAEFFGGLRILYWLEVLSLIGGLKKGLDALGAVSGIYNVSYARLKRYITLNATHAGSDRDRSDCKRRT